MKPESHGYAWYYAIYVRWHLVKHLLQFRDMRLFWHIYLQSSEIKRINNEKRIIILICDLYIKMYYLNLNNKIDKN